MLKPGFVWQKKIKSELKIEKQNLDKKIKDKYLNFNKDESYNNNLSLKVQRTSNNTYFRNHSINTALVNSENTNLENEIKYSFNKDDIYFNIKKFIFSFNGIFSRQCNQKLKNQ